MTGHEGVAVKPFRLLVARVLCALVLVAAASCAGTEDVGTSPPLGPTDPGWVPLDRPNIAHQKKEDYCRAHTTDVWRREDTFRPYLEFLADVEANPSLWAELCDREIDHSGFRASEMAVLTAELQAGAEVLIRAELTDAQWVYCHREFDSVVDAAEIIGYLSAGASSGFVSYWMSARPLEFVSACTVDWEVRLPKEGS